MTLEPLPIDPLLPRICDKLRQYGTLVVEAPPGSGKTTRIPAALRDFGAVARDQQIVVSEPRRLAARLAARRVAMERCERLGGVIGYSVRFEDVSSDQTRIRYVTEGVLVRRLLEDPELATVGAVVLDEFHERHLATDMALALLERLRASRPTLKLVVMSATLDAEPLAAFLGGCPRIASGGTMFPVAIEHLERPDDRPLEKQVASAVRRLLHEQEEGDVLVFLPGASEIRRAAERLAPIADEHRVLVLPLHGDMRLEDQARAVERAELRKVILSTNVAESSVTIEGVTAVVDSGLSRVAAHSPWTGLPRLSVSKVSRASAAQRAGRAGRVRPGRVLRLYTSGDLAARPEQQAPEIRRADLSEALLWLYGASIQPESLRFLDPPAPEALATAQNLLELLGATTDGALSEVGRRLLDFPLHPRLARLVVEGERHGIGEQAALAAALLSERDIRKSTRAFASAGSRADVLSGDSDVVALLDLFEEAQAANFAAHRLRALGLDAGSVRAVDRAARQLTRLVRDVSEPAYEPDARERALRAAVLRAFPDRVAKRRRRGARELVLSTGQAAELSDLSVVTEATLMVAIDIEERTATRGRAVVRLASAIEPEWLLDWYTERLAESDELVFDEATGRVERITRLTFGSIVLEESRAPARPSPEASRVLARAAMARGAIAALDRLERLAARLDLLARTVPEARAPVLGDDAPRAAVERASQGRTSLAELSALDLEAELIESLSPELRRLLAEQTPERVSLPGGRSVVVTYERDKPPFIASRLQDFFGMRETPRLCHGRQPLTLHLLAPNQRAVQVTSDLDGFWKRHYPTLRRELMRRYPKHAWPEDGASATPPAARRRR